MAVDIYFGARSHFCRSVQMAEAALGVELNLIDANALPGGTQGPKLAKINPQHTIPRMKDGDFILWESRAILGYLVNKYGKDDKLYPKDPVKRAIVDQRLYFDMGTLFPRFPECFAPVIQKIAPLNLEMYKRLEEAFGFLNIFLANNRYAAGEDLTIADFALLATVSCFVDGGPRFPLSKYPNVKRWYEDGKVNFPGYDRTIAGLDELKAMFVDYKAPEEV